MGASVLVAVGATTLALGSEQARPVDTPTQAAPQGGGLALPGGSTGAASGGADASDPFLEPAPYANAGGGGSGVVHALPQAPAPLVPAANRSSADGTAPAASTTSGSGTSPVPASSSAPLSMPVSLPSLPSPSSGGASALPLLGGGSPQRAPSQGSGGLLSPLLGGGSGNRGQQDQGSQDSRSAQPTVLAMPGSTVNQIGNDVGQVLGLPDGGGQGSASLLDAPGVLGSVLSGTTGGTTSGEPGSTGTVTQPATGTTGSGSTGSSTAATGSATQSVNNNATAAALLAQVKAAAERKRAAALAAQQAEQADQQSSQQDQQDQQAAAMRQMVQAQIRKQQDALLAALAAQRAGTSQAQQSQAQQSQVQQARLLQAQQAQKALQARVAQQYASCVAAGKQQQVRAQRDEDGQVTGVTCSTSS